MTGGYTMKEKNIRELAKRMGLITVEDMCQYTIAQLVVKIANKVNELVDEVWRFETDVQEILKTQNEKIQYLLTEGLHSEIINLFMEWVNNGTFDKLINQTLLKSVNNRIDETSVRLSNEIDVERKRIDGITSLSEGSTTGDAELMDVRISYDGVTYPTAGKSVRSQVNQINNGVIGIKTMCLSSQNFDFLMGNFIEGYWLNKNNPEVYVGWGYTPNFIPVNPGETLYFRKTVTKDSFSEIEIAPDIYISEYDLTGKFIRQFYTSKSSNGEYTLLDKCHFIRLSMSLSDMKKGIRYKMANHEITEIKTPFKKGVYKDEQLATSLAKTRFIEMSSPRILTTSKTPIFIYPENLVIDGDTLNPQFYLNDRLPLTQQPRRFYRERGYVGFKEYQLTAIYGVSPRSYYLYDGCYTESKTLTLDSIDPKMVGNGLVKRVMFIGDSITAEGTYVSRVKSLFADDVSQIELIGTLGGTDKHEGRGGWSAKTYCTQSSYNGNNNAFLNPSTGKFDFSYYMNHNGFNGVDMVFINLGINDLNENPYSDTNYSNIMGYYKEMIASIKNYSSSIKILCGLCILPANYENNVSSLGQTNYSKKERQLFIEIIQRELNSMVDVFVPYFLTVDTKNDFPTEMRCIDEYNEEKVCYCTDITHPKKSGYLKMGDMSYNYIKHLM